ncbi:MAG: hypothetical protein AAFY08_14085 [Planctomycetota bacterium]
MPPEDPTPRPTNRRRLAGVSPAVDALAARLATDDDLEGFASVEDALREHLEAIDLLTQWMSKHVDDVFAIRAACGEAFDVAPESIRRLDHDQLRAMGSLALIGVNRCLLDEARLFALDLVPGAFFELAWDDESEPEVVRLETRPRPTATVVRLEAPTGDDVAVVDTRRLVPVGPPPPPAVAPDTHDDDESGVTR